MPRWIVPGLNKFASDNDRNKQFVEEFVGCTVPPRIPHCGHWVDAQRCWFSVIKLVAESDRIPQDASVSEAIQLSLAIAVDLLDVLLRVGVCPCCPVLQECR